ncbi:RING finger and CHY zinc finger domain-containing protein 1 [Frankliniella fusca]|uniref:RING finger and CHY zinc finger domain-containing protein 1 n=1 Tax=Frankliniella fusca TaxID=407009 RepID=A0AAE1LC56_9NEOP|nr:RING finger and CHY zinc finger domain-containing protein 1 [Frankliniella fusca]
MEEGSTVSTTSTAPAEGGSYVGCCHYQRRSKFVTPCCNKVYTCRFCHDENENHPVNRKDVTELVCTSCNTRQKVQARCEKCNLIFGKYTCLECKLFDDEDKKQYHCDGCGICRIGGRDKFFHCEKCNMCLPIKLLNKHKCVENVSRGNCPVCLEDIHTSRMPCHIPDCGHLLHRNCFEELLTFGHYACPICQTSLLDMSRLWKYFDEEIKNTPMPEEFMNFKAEILCKDCHKESTVTFHVVALKCANCGSYNTCRIKGSPYCIDSTRGSPNNEGQTPGTSNSASMPSTSSAAGSSASGSSSSASTSSASYSPATLSSLSASMVAATPESSSRASTSQGAKSTSPSSSSSSD